MFYIVSYDIPEDKRRGKIADILLDFGCRVQYSVFECLLDDPEKEKMIERLERHINKDEDSVRLYSLCKGCEKTIRIIGRGVLTKDVDVFIL